MKHRRATEAYRGDAVPATRGGQVLWVTVAVVFLALLSLVLWMWVRTRAKGEAAGDPHREYVVDTQPISKGVYDRQLPPLLPISPDLPADAEPAYPSPFRPTPETISPAETERSTGDDEIIYHRRKNDRMEIALSFDDGPHPYYTPLILDILAEYNIRATFFMIGENVRYYSAAAEAVVAGGHEIGNHTFSHCKFNRMNEHEMRDEISACEDAISSVAECRPHFLRPPEGQLNETMRRVIGSLDYRIVLWDVDTRDWAHTPPATICQHILDTVQAGDIILMHDFIGHDSPTPEALRLVIPELLARGYRFVTVGELVDGS